VFRKIIDVVTWGRAVCLYVCKGERSVCPAPPAHEQTHTAICYIRIHGHIHTSHLFTRRCYWAFVVYVYGV